MFTASDKAPTTFDDKPKLIKMNRFLFFLIPFLIFCTEIISQVKSNEYFEVLDFSIYNEQQITPLEDGEFLYAPFFKKTGPVYIINEDLTMIELPCDNVRRIFSGRNTSKKEDLWSCHKNGKGALFSMKTFQPLMPFYDSIRFFNAHFYLVWEKDSLFVFNTDIELIYKSNLDLSKQESTRKILTCYEDVLHFRLKEESFFLNKKGEVYKHSLCENYSNYAVDQYGNYIFRKDKKFGLNNKKGRVLLEPIYEFISLWKNGKYIVSFRDDKSNSYLSGLVNKKGKFLIPLKNERIAKHEFGLVIRRGDKYIFLDHKLKNKYKKEFDKLIVSKSGFVHGTIGEQQFYDLIFTKKNELTKGSIERGYAISDDYCFVKFKKGLYKIYDSSGNTVFSSKDKIRGVNQLVDNIFRISYEMRLHGLIDVKNNWIVKPGDYSFKSAKNKDGIFMFDFTTKESHLINSKGERIYSNVRKATYSRSTQNYIVKNDYGNGLVSPQGELIIPFGDYTIFELQSTTPIYYRLKSGKIAYLVQVK